MSISWWLSRAYKQMLVSWSTKLEWNASLSASTTRMHPQWSTWPSTWPRSSRSTPRAAVSDPLASLLSSQVSMMEGHSFSRLNPQVLSANGRPVPSERSLRNSVSTLRTSTRLDWTRRQHCVWRLRPSLKWLNRRRTWNSASSRLVTSLSLSLSLACRLLLMRSTQKERLLRSPNVPTELLLSENEKIIWDLYLSLLLLGKSSRKRVTWGT